ncbi:hypothetical protein GCM10020229_47390 [Kitasatospora albolonga]
MVLVSTSPGEASVPTNARTALRSWPIVAAAPDAVPLDVPDHQRDAAAARDRVVPVPADLHPPGARQVARRHRQARDPRQPVRQQRLLQAPGQRELGVVQPRPVQGLGDQPAQCRQHRALLAADTLGRSKPRMQLPTGSPEATSGRKGPGPHLVLGQARVGRLQLVGRLEEHRRPAAEHLSTRHPGPHRDALEGVQEAVRVPRLRDQVHPAAAGEVERQLLAAEPGQDLVDHAVADSLTVTASVSALASWSRW